MFIHKVNQNWLLATAGVVGRVAARAGIRSAGEQDEIILRAPVTGPNQNGHEQKCHHDHGHCNEKPHDQTSVVG
ncbi:hypothetical protein UFOVP29_338 [uncultured Caudovirales phage]|uniref:Uncharacterized protein n=1 Tax=uncultured Caudovirales phage TaxID=2100421 RepID=A0A6J5KSJ0_9CAUD|nr:hypothetical protein UFOVP29_338 [uncultured Caudovirales phage]